MTKNFSDFDLPSGLSRALEKLGFAEPTPIQQQMIPKLRNGGDFIALAQTGSGKTAAFLIPMITRLLSEEGANALVLVPTRELAQQVNQVWQDLTQFCRGLRSMSMVGGASFSAQVKQLQAGPRLVVATPGRLTDHLTQGTIKLTHVAVLVLDEADRMLDMGFERQLGQIRKHLPENRQTLMFSATWDSKLDQLTKKYQRSPVRVTVGAVSRPAMTIDQSMRKVDTKKKNEILMEELVQREGSILVFARTQSRTDRLARYLNSYGLDVGRLHGGRSQGQRNSTLNSFRNGKLRVVVATDLASRGLDVVDVAHVINYDLPMLAEDYVHRIGRTGRAGKAGKALSLITPEDKGQWNEITQFLKKTGYPSDLLSAHTR